VPPNNDFHFLKTYCAGESVSSRVCQIRRRTLGTCPLLTANFTRSRRFLEAPSRGFTLVEILIVVVIIGIALSLTTSNLFISEKYFISHYLIKSFIKIQCSFSK
jgi:prepilin-type N-terminal cleavage/methylation domain-containing protein